MDTKLSMETIFVSLKLVRFTIICQICYPIFVIFTLLILNILKLLPFILIKFSVH